MKRPLFVLSLLVSFTLTGFSQEDYFLSREQLFGDGGGLRPFLEERGLSYEFIYTAEFFRNMSGGIKKGNEYRGDISLFLELDTESAGLWENGSFFAHLQEEH